MLYLHLISIAGTCWDFHVRRIIQTIFFTGQENIDLFPSKILLRLVSYFHLGNGATKVRMRNWLVTAFKWCLLNIYVFQFSTKINQVKHLIKKTVAAREVEFQSIPKEDRCSIRSWISKNSLLPNQTYVNRKAWLARSSVHTLHMHI